MTESKRLACDDPRPMLEFLRRSGKASARKFRLFGCACARREWHLLTGKAGGLRWGTRGPERLAFHPPVGEVTSGSGGNRASAGGHR
jgi:hypothetical protein